MPLHDNTRTFLTVRNAFREALAEALQSESTADPAAPVVNEFGDDTECEIDARTEQAGCASYAGLEIVPSIECASDDNGWPNTAALYQTLNLALTDPEDTNNNAAAQIRLMRQINLMESYRKMLLHKKQRTPQFMTIWCQCLQSEAQSQQEIEQLLLNQAIGVDLDPTNDTVEEEAPEEEA